MQCITEQSGCLLRPTCVTIGKFDGFHAGHRKLLSVLLEHKTEEMDSCVVSIRTGFLATGQQIYTEEEQRFLCENMGIDYLAEYDLGNGMRDMEPEQFIADYIIKQLHALVIVIGEDFHFGKGRSGDVAMLQRLQEKYHYTTVVVPAVSSGGEKISSTRIRKLLQEGDIETANRLLKRQYMVLGEIVHGKQLGAKLGFPTINVVPPEKKALPAYGVYATKVKVGGFWYYGVSNVGVRPTVESVSTASVETNLIHCNEDLYGKEAQIYFLKFLRPERKFDSLTALKEQIEKDRKMVEELYKTEALY